MPWRRRGRLALLVVAAAADPAMAQSPQSPSRRATITADVTYYGDNTEFANPFREGDTLLGVAGFLVFAVDVNDRVRVEAGVFGNQRFGSAKAFEQVRPVLALSVHDERHQFRMGTFAPAITLPLGGDRQILHGLVPPLQSETLSFVRPWEAGLQWTTATIRLRQEAWLNWQQLNTAQHREKFDTGVAGIWQVLPRAGLVYQWHLVHRGGQLFAVGPVSDSYAVALGPRVSTMLGSATTLSLEVLGLASRDVPDREVPAERRSGKALFVRGAAERGGWRGHVLVFRGWDFVKAEGDANYQAVRRDGTAFRNVRDYAEAGLARQFRPAPGVALEASFRLHRVEANVEYSYRIIGRTHLAWLLP